MIRLIDCHRCHVLVDDGNKKIEAHVVHNKESVKLYFTIASLKDARIKTKIMFYDDIMGILRGECELLIHRNHSETRMQYPWMADCVIDRLRMDENNRRQAVRIKTDIAVTLSSKFHGTFLGTIKDLSVGGLLLSTAQILAKEEELTFTYNFGKGMCKFYAVPVRGEAATDGRYRYGCKFIQISEAEETMIGKYLFKRQQELRQQI